MDTKTNDGKPESAILHSGGPDLLLAAVPPAYLVNPVVCFFVSRGGQPIDLRQSFTFLASDTNKSALDTKESDDGVAKSSSQGLARPDWLSIPSQPS